MGYLTGLNMMWDARRGTPGNPLNQLGSSKQAFLWMDNYCKANPLNSVADGGMDLILELAEKAKKR